jgi:hypothetical protein
MRDIHTYAAPCINLRRLRFNQLHDAADYVIVLHGAGGKGEKDGMGSGEVFQEGVRWGVMWGNALNAIKFCKSE